MVVEPRDPAVLDVGEQHGAVAIERDAIAERLAADLDDCAFRRRGGIAERGGRDLVEVIVRHRAEVQPPAVGRQLDAIEPHRTAACGSCDHARVCLARRPSCHVRLQGTDQGMTQTRRRAGPRGAMVEA